MKEKAKSTAYEQPESDPDVVLECNDDSSITISVGRQSISLTIPEALCLLESLEPVVGEFDESN